MIEFIVASETQMSISDLARAHSIKQLLTKELELYSCHDHPQSANIVAVKSIQGNASFAFVNCCCHYFEKYMSEVVKAKMNDY